MTAITRKEWILYKDKFDNTDYTWITGLGCHVEVDRDDPKEVQMYGQTFHYLGRNPMIIVFTTCEKQESMLKLKYGDDLGLRSTYNELPHTIFEP